MQRLLTNWTDQGGDLSNQPIGWDEVVDAKQLEKGFDLRLNQSESLEEAANMGDPSDRR